MDEDVKMCPFCKKKPIIDKRTSRLSSGSTYDEWKLHCSNPTGLSTIWHSIRSEAVSKWNEMVARIEKERKDLGR